MQEFPLRHWQPKDPIQGRETVLSGERILPVRFHFIPGSWDDAVRTGFEYILFLPDPSKTWHRFHEYPDWFDRLVRGQATVQSIETVGRSGCIQAKGLVVQRAETTSPKDTVGHETYTYDPAFDPELECIFPLHSAPQAPREIQQWWGSVVVGILEPNPSGEVSVGILPGSSSMSRKAIVRLAPRLNLVSPDISLPFGIKTKEEGEIIPVAF